MKFSPSILFSCLLALIVLSSCEENESPIYDGLSVLDNFRHAPLKIELKHTINVSPCPQGLSTFPVVKCNTGAAGDSCTVDRVEIIKNHQGYTCEFANNATSILFDDAFKEHDMDFKFTCNIAQSFTDTFELKFYYQNIEVVTEKVAVDITVE